MFKVPKEEDIDGAVAQYAILRSTAEKVIEDLLEKTMCSDHC